MIAKIIIDDKINPGKYFVHSKEYLIPAGLSHNLEKAKEEFIEELADLLEIDKDEIDLEVVQ